MGGVPEAGQGLGLARGVPFQMAGEHGGQRAGLAPAHGIGLAGDAEGAAAGLAQAAMQDVAVDDGIRLIGAGGGLVGALAEEGDGFAGGGEPFEEAGGVGWVEAGVAALGL